VLQDSRKIFACARNPCLARHSAIPCAAGTAERVKFIFTFGNVIT
jgi:hypothetical protein